MAADEIRRQIKKYVDKADEKTLSIVQTILEAADEYDALANLSAEDEQGILQGLKDADEGRVTPHKEVMKKYRKWLK